MTNVEVAFHDAALAEMDSFIAAHPPERGGALIGPVGQPVVSMFLPDPDAAVTGVTYTPSGRLRQLVAVTEREQPALELKGIVHSHPSGMDHPSGGDHRAYADSLRKAPWLGRFICPIITAHAREAAAGQHRVQLRSGIMSVYVAEARVDGAVRVEPARPRVIPFRRDVAVLAGRLSAVAESAWTHTEVDGTLYAAASLRDEATDVTALFPPLYPTAPPLILLTRRAEAKGTSRLSQLATHIADGKGDSTGTVALPLPWSLNIDEQDRLGVALDNAIAQALGRGHAARPTGSPAHSAAGDVEIARDGIRARLKGAVASSVQSARVLLVGLGSGGSQTAEALTRASVEHFILIDPDQVAAENLSRSVYQLADVGDDKTEALATRLAAINPAVTTRAVTSSLDDIADQDLTDMIKASDLVIAATDDPKAQLRLNHLAWSLGIPAVFAGVYARGQAGEVVFTVPGLDQIRCYRCATANRRHGNRADAGINYGTGQLNAEPALGADISHIVTASVKIAIGLLELSSPGTSRHSAANLVATALANHYQFVILSTIPAYDFFPRVFGTAAAQHGYQTVWMSVEENPDCPTCGTSPLAAEEFVTSGANLAALRPVAEEITRSEASVLPPDHEPEATSANPAAHAEVPGREPVSADDHTLS
jgi:proteasome lid subunit RPN8/RPN11